MSVQFESMGYYIEGCGLSGEKKEDDVFPAQHNTIQVARDRWFVIYETRGFRGNDDNRSVVYQVRAGNPRGAVLSEGYLDQATQDWDPLGDGRRFVKLCNHSVAFGVPEGAIGPGGSSLPHAGVFAAAWRRNPRILDKERNYLVSEREIPLPSEAYRCHWCQFRLNATRDNIEIIKPVAPLLERGAGTPKVPSRHEQLTTMNQGYVVPVPYNREATEWVFLLHWSQGANEDTGVCTAIKFQWNAERGFYEWVETGPILDGPGEMGLFEGAIAPYGSDWLIGARITPRKHLGMVWFRTHDLFCETHDPVYSPEIRSHAPRTFYCCPDGVIRVFTTDQENSPYRVSTGWDPRMPLEAFEVDPDHGFKITGRSVVYDGIKNGELPIRPEAGPTAHFCRLIAHAGGDEGLLTYSVRPKALLHPKPGPHFKGRVLPEEMDCAGVYCTRIRWQEEYPPLWSFSGSGKQ